MAKQTAPSWMGRLLTNNRFWVLTGGITLSVVIAGLMQLLVPDTKLQIIRIGQCYGFIAMVLLFLALLASPLTKAYPNLPFKDGYLHARRGIGVLAFYYAFLHVWLTFFKELGGFSGIHYYDTKYTWALLLGIAALAILFILTSTSMDWVIRVMSFPRWKRLQRLVYFAALAILAHVALIGPHYAGLDAISVLTGVGLVVLLSLEGLRIYRNLTQKKQGEKR